MEAALRARLLDLAAVGGRVYWDERPQGSALPALTLSIVNDRRPENLKGFDVPETLVQVDVWAANFADKRSIREAVIAVLSPPATVGGIEFMRATEINSRGLNERTETAFIFRDAIDFLFRWKEA